MLDGMHKTQFLLSRSLKPSKKDDNHKNVYYFLSMMLSTSHTLDKPW